MIWYLKGGETMKNYDEKQFVMEIQAITTSLNQTLKQKNADYGNNVDKNIDEWGLSSLAIRLDDKLSRFKNLIKEGNSRQVSDETLEDTLLDLAGYAILGYRKIQEMKTEKLVESVVTTIKNDSTPIIDVDRKPVYAPRVKTQGKQGSTTFTFNE